jgi:S1-C subfamily serine protease
MKLINCALIVAVVAGGLSLTAPASASSVELTTGLLMSQDGPDLLMLEGESEGVRVLGLRWQGSDTLLRQGDLIIRADGIALVLPEDLFAYLRTHPTLDSVSLVVRRGHEELTLTVGADLFAYFMPPAPPAPPEIPS